MGAVMASTLEMAGFAIAPMLGPWAAYMAVAIGSPGSMAFPVISALKSVHAGEDEQGTVQVRHPLLLPSCHCVLCSPVSGPNEHRAGAVPAARRQLGLAPSLFL